MGAGATTYLRILRNPKNKTVGTATGTVGASGVPSAGHAWVITPSQIGPLGRRGATSVSAGARTIGTGNRTSISHSQLLGGAWRLWWMAGALRSDARGL